MRNGNRLTSMILAAIVVAASISVVLPLPARGCSCAPPGDLVEWVGQSEAVFVGTLVEKLDAGPDPFGAPEAIYVFEVETWVKGDLGDVIEVHSAADGAGCGFEFWDPGRRTGAAIHEQDGTLRGGLCDQIDADVLLAAMESPTPSATGVGKLIVANGWSSTKLTVLDEVGHHVADLRPAVDEPEWSGTQDLAVCPDGELFVQMTETSVSVWDMVTLESVATHPLALEGGWATDLSCQAEDASSIWVLASNDIESTLHEVAGEPAVLADLRGVNGSIGSGFVVLQTSHDGDAVMVDLGSGEETVLTSKPPNTLISLYSAPHPTDALAAVLETSYPENGQVSSTLTIFDHTGAVVTSTELPFEALSPTWLDSDRIALQAYDSDNWENSHLLVYDVDEGATIEVEGWTGQHTVSSDGLLYGIDGGTIVTADLETGEIAELATISSPQAGPIVLRTSGEALDPDTTTTTGGEEEPPAPRDTIPPLVAPDPGSSGDGGRLIQWIAVGAIVAFLGTLVWLGLRKPRTEDV